MSASIKRVFRFRPMNEGPSSGRWIIVFPMKNGRVAGVTDHVDAGSPEEALRIGLSNQPRHGGLGKIPVPDAGEIRLERRQDGGFSWEDDLVWVYPAEIEAKAALALMFWTGDEN